MDIDSISGPAVANTSRQLDIKSAVIEQKPQQAVAPLQGSQQETKQETQDQIHQVNSKLEEFGIGLSFSVDEGTQSSVITVIDKKTNEVIKQFPNDGSLQIMKNIQNYLDSVQQSSIAKKEGLTGILFNEMV